MKYILENEQTARLHFRLLEPSDFDDWLPLFDTNDPKRFLGFDTNMSPREICEKWFTTCQQRYDDNLGGMNVLVDKSSGKMIGQCGLLIQEVAGSKRLEIGYSILPAYWGKGYATEAALKCRDFAFERDYWPSLISIVHVENIGSEKVARKNGMSLVMPNETFKGMEVNIFGIDRSEWEKLSAR